MKKITVPSRATLRNGLHGSFHCVSYRDPVTGKRFRFLTNNFVLPALTIAQLYKARWNIEVFFKWIKQHLHIKSFYGNSENAVKTQIWIAISVYLLTAIARKKLGVGVSLYTFFQVLGMTVFEKSPILEVLQNPSSTIDHTSAANQLNLFDF